MMRPRLLRLKKGEGHDHAKSRGGFYSWLERGYMWVLALAMRHRWWVAVCAVLVILSSIPLYHRVPQEFVPSSTDEGEFEVSLTAAEGTSLKQAEHFHYAGIEYQIPSKYLK